MAETVYVPRLRTQFDREIRGKLTEQFGYANVMQVPRLEKVVLNMGVGEAVNDRKKAETAAADLALIAGQKPIVTYSRVAIATFKLRENQPIGCKVTLRKAKMYEFIDRLINVALPRVRDFRGLNPKSFDGRGNYSLGIKEHIIFPEIDFDKMGETWGMDITVCTTAATDDEARANRDVPSRHCRLKRVFALNLACPIGFDRNIRPVRVRTLRKRLSRCGLIVTGRHRFRVYGKRRNEDVRVN